jgi:hypothetical protein
MEGRSLSALNQINTRNGNCTSDGTSAFIQAIVKSECSGGGGANGFQRIAAAIGFLAVILALGACERREDVKNKPLAAWLSDSDACVRQTAQSIMASGRPWPNEIRDQSGYLTRIDLWLANQLYVLPVEAGFAFAINEASRNAPIRYSFFGNVENILDVPPERYLQFKHPGVVSTLYGSIRCYNHEPKDKWVESTWPNASTRTALLAQITNAESLNPVQQDRQDIRMTEVRRSDSNASSQRPWFTYVPMDRDISQNVNGARILKTIECSVGYNIDGPLRTAELCTTWVYLGPGLWLELSVYQQAMSLLPDLHDYILNYFHSNREQ